MPSNSYSTVRPIPSAVTHTAPISAAPSALSVIVGFKSAAATAGFGNGFERSLHGSPDVLSLLVARPPSTIANADPLLSAYKSFPSPSIGITPRPTPAARAPTDLGAHLIAESDPGVDGGGARTAPAVEPIRSPFVVRRNASRRPASPLSPAADGSPPVPTGESSADAAARDVLQSHYPTFANLFPNTHRAIYGERSASPALASLPVDFLIRANGQATDAYGALLLCCASAAADAPANGAPSRLLAQYLQDPRRADVTIAQAIRSGAITWTPSPLDTAMCFLPLGHFALHAILQQYVISNYYLCTLNNKKQKS